MFIIVNLPKNKTKFIVLKLSTKTQVFYHKSHNCIDVSNKLNVKNIIQWQSFYTISFNTTAFKLKDSNFYYLHLLY